MPATVQLHRVGEHEHVLDHGLDKLPVLDDDSPDVSWGLALRRLHTDLVDAGAPAVVTAAIDRVIDVISANRHGHRESAAKRDRVLRQLGLSTAQIGALVALVGGTRRRGVEDSLWFQHHAQHPERDASISEPARVRIDAFVGGFVEPVSVSA